MNTALAADEPEPLRVGGIVPADKAYIVGEEGCTLVIPARGRMYPVDTATTDGAGNVTVTFTVPDDGSAVVQSLREAIGRGHWSLIVPDAGDRGVG